MSQYFDCLNTMFNILLIIAGILEYVLLGIAFKVRFCYHKAPITLVLNLTTRQISKIHILAEY